jgi:hypothetical protein
MAVEPPFTSYGTLEATCRTGFDDLTKGSRVRRDSNLLMRPVVIVFDTVSVHPALADAKYINQLIDIAIRNYNS